MLKREVRQRNDSYILTPKYLLRIACVEYATKGWTPGSFLEMGAGRGYMTSLFLQRGFQGACYDLGDKTRGILRERLKRYEGSIEVVDEIGALGERLFDYLFAFEVLEHIEDDREALRLWSSHLRKGGRALISVPAHMKKFGSADDFVGHVRRYEKEQLLSLLREEGYDDITILNCGFPLGNVSRWVGSLLYSKEYSVGLTAVERSVRSGIERATHVSRVSFLVREGFIAPFAILQRFFFLRDWGDGYVVTAVKK